MEVNERASDGDKKVADQEKIFVPAPECCIYRVPKKLRKIKEEAYTPQFISIGPFHHDNKELAHDIQNQKKRYRDEFIKRIGKEKFEELRTFVEQREQRIRNCYAEVSKLSSQDFIEMILVDAAFIIELFSRSYYRHGRDFLLDQLWLTKAIKLDLQLLENQLPYFVLDELYRLAFARQTGEISPLFLYISCQFFEFDKDAVRSYEGKFKHFLDLRRYAMVKFRPQPKDSEATVKEGSIEEGIIEEDLPFAVMLNESGVRFKALPISKPADRLRLLGIKFEKGKGRIPLYKRLELQIPRIVIEDCTECLMRNLMALEQCHYPSQTHICNYVALIDSLVNTRKDVDLLFEKGIISNRVGDHTAISVMFNKLCLQITTSESCYNDIIKDLKAYHKRWLNRTKATLKSVYFRDIWRGTATAAVTNHAKIVAWLDSTSKLSCVVAMLLCLEWI